MMKLIISKENILSQLFLQLKSNFLFDNEEEDIVKEIIDVVLDRCEYNFQRTDNKYFRDKMVIEGEVKFNPYHSVQYMTFLYYLSNELHRQNCSGLLCDKVYYLNKIMNGVDLFYAINLPDVFSAEHPVSSVMGRASYGNGFFFYQGCTVGGTIGKEGVIHYPVIGENVRMFSNSSILGKCRIGNNVKIGAGAIVKNQDVPDNTIVFGVSPNLVIKIN